MHRPKAVHQCLFCRQTFDSAADKDDHILGHFAKEKCLECKENLIRIGGYLYTRHNETTCIKKVTISKEHVESCMQIDAVQSTPKSHTLTRNVRSTNKSARGLDAAHTPQTQTVPKGSDESVSATSGSEMMSSVLVDGLSIPRRFPKVNLNPVVVLEDILTKKTDPVRPPELKRCETETRPNLHNTVRSDDTCTLTFKRREYLSNHMTIQTGAKPYPCTHAHCKERFRNRLYKYQHVLGKHSREETSVCDNNGRQKTFSTEGSSEIHIDNEHDTANTSTTNYSCFVCLETFNVKTNLVKHIEEKHKTVESCNDEHQSIEQIEPQFVPSIFSRNQKKDKLNGADLKTEGKELLIELDLNGQQDDSRERNDCDETFEMQHLDKEAAYHDEIGEFNCDICNEKFSMRHCLSAHINRAHNPDAEDAEVDASTHENIGSNLKCRYRGCEQRFENEEDIILHMQKHHNEKHVCSIDGCGKQFMFRSVLKLHQMKEHSSGKLYNCTYEHCKERFKTRAQKSQHIFNVHSQGNLYACDIDGCEKVLSSSQSLKFHRANEHFTSTFHYSCDICPEIFIRKATLMKHVAEKHKTFELRNTKEQHIESTQQQDEQSVVSKQEENSRTEANFDTKVEEELIIEPQTNEPNSQQELSRERIGGDETIASQNPAESDQLRPSTGSAEFVCEICKQEFTDRRDLKAHVARQHGPNTKTFKCDICGVFGLHRHELKIHIESVHY